MYIASLLGGIAKGSKRPHRLSVYFSNVFFFSLPLALSPRKFTLGEDDLLQNARAKGLCNYIRIYQTFD